MSQLASLTALIALITSACGPLDTRRDAPDPDRYRKAIERAQADGLTVYWLGQRFSAAGVAFDAIDSEDPAHMESPVTSLLLHYTPVSDAHSGELDITSYSQDAWAAVRARRLSPPSVSVEHDSVSVAGRTAEFVRYGIHRGDPTGLGVVLPFGETVVFARTNMYIGRDENGQRVQLNPMLDEELFLQTLENLRPYRE